MDVLAHASQRGIYLIPENMTGTSSAKARRRGRPPVGSTQLSVRLTPAQLARLDAWIAQQPGNVSRPEALRRLAIAILGQEEG